MDKLDLALEAARQRGAEWKQRFQLLTAEQKTEEIARMIYYRVHTHTEAPTWDGLPDMTVRWIDDETYTKQPYLTAASLILSILT